MMYSHSIIPLLWSILLLVLQTKTDSTFQPRCQGLLQNFAEVVSNFTFCAVNNSRPFRFCCHCKDHYVETVKRHRVIVDDKTCHSDLIMGEKYQLVESAYNFVEGLWKSSNCPHCFKVGPDGLPNNIDLVIKEFFLKLKDVEQCFSNNSKNGQIVPIPVNNSNSSEINKGLCENCEKIYKSLEESYKAITNSDSLEYKICADVSASMNYTRQCWSKTFHCVKINTDTVSVVALTVFFCLLPVIFYTSVKLHGDSNNKKTESYSRVS
ncbi:osteopetrosis-associated transmembrane protein 1-like [Montipora capricornis]|uniref:osteopetrosis-associated transmembrane protein 1-like n=1 Tax=Montipora capricornis TaxID=246305 RepID=UPI0035F17A7F